MVETPAEQWIKTISSLREKCKAIVSSSKDIRYAGAINSYGRTLTGIIAPNVTPLLSLRNARNEFFTLAMLVGQREPHNVDIGEMEHIILCHKKAIAVLLQKDNLVFYISIDPKTGSLDEIIRGIKSRI